MSYANMDHAAWVESNNAAARRMSQGKKPRADIQKGYAAAPEKLSDFQAKVFDILGMVGGGIYNCPIAWEGIQWKGHGRDGIAVPWRGSLATFDFGTLTRLVLLCLEARIRCHVKPHSFGYLLLSFYQRSDEGGSAERHPNIDEAVADFRKYLPAGHRVSYRKEAPVAAAALEQAPQRAA